MITRVNSISVVMCWLLAALAVHAGEAPRDPPGGESTPTDFAIGADLSFLKQAEERGIRFRDGGDVRPGLEIFRDHGYNWIRLRLFHTPTRLPNDLEYTIASARAARKLGFKFLLNYHYSDTWADPGHQVIPEAWKGMSHPELVRAVFEYTRETIAAFRKAGVLPDMVQVGNEITPGMLWPDGKLPEKWDHFGELVRAGIRGVEAGRGDGPRPRIMIHIDKGGGKGATKWFFDKLHSYDIQYDVIGQSYYPWWHGSLDDLRENMAFMARVYKKDIMLVEVAFCWRPTEYKNKPAPFPETPAGQKEFLETVTRIVRETPNRRGIGVFWWEPAVTGRLRSRGFFDDEGNALPVINVFDPVKPGTPDTDEASTSSPVHDAESILRRHGKRDIRVHDPSAIVKCKDTYWLFATGRGVQSWHSPDLFQWERGPRVFSGTPAWISKVVPGNRGYFWAPDVIQHNGRYLLYYSISRFGRNTSAIALVSNTTLDGTDPASSWRDDGAVIISNKDDDFNAIDPAITLAGNGSLWMSFGSFWSGIKLVQLDPETGKRLVPDSPIHSLAYYEAIEAPHIYRHGNFYYLFVNWDRCCRGVESTYNIRFGRSREITGPYLDHEGIDLMAGGGTLLLATDGPFIGPGHASVFEKNGKFWISCHFYDGTRSGSSRLAIQPLEWGADGWPEPEPVNLDE